MNILSVENISKRYGTVRALDDVSFTVPEGSVYGILGPNGSGKTTLLGIITDVVRADAGTFTLLEDRSTPAHLLRREIGTLLETPNFYSYLPAYDNLVIAAEIKGADRAEIDPVLQKVGLYERRHSRFSTYSLGMKQRLGIASALLGNPRVLILDEPTNGLDPEGIAEIRNLIKELGTAGHTVILASHLLDEVEKVCTHVAILKKGKLLAQGKADEIMAQGDTVEMAAANIDQLYGLIVKNFPGEKVSLGEDTVSLGLSGGQADTASINSLCHDNGIILTRLLLKKKSMESIFLEVVGNSKNG